MSTTFSLAVELPRQAKRPAVESVPHRGLGCYFASQLLKRSFSSSWLSVQNGVLVASAFLKLVGAVGMCPAMGSPVSAWVEIRAMDDLRAGPYEIQL